MQQLYINQIKHSLLEAIDSCRAGVMDTFELELSDHPNWKFIRSRILKCFGDKGLSGRVYETLNKLNEDCNEKY